jgi:ligand-binding sensor domain-containing protein
MRVKLKHCCLCLCLLSAIAQAQYRFDNWTADNGLPQNSVRDIVQTRDGYLWLATFDGLVRFDGVRFTVFNKSNTPGVLTNRFVKLYEDGQGDLWASTESGDALTRLHDRRFTTYTKENGLPQYFNHLGGDGQGRLLVFSEEHLWRWLDERFQLADQLRLPATTGHVAARDVAQHLAYGTPEGKPFWYFGAGEWRILSGEIILKLGLGLPMEDRQRRCWMGSFSGLYRDEQGRLAPGQIQNEKLRGRPTMLVTGRQPLQAVVNAADGSLWLVEVETGQSRLLAQQPPDSALRHTTAGKDLASVYADREGNLWLGTYTNGLFRARPRSLTSYGKAQGLTDLETYPVLEDRAGTLWAGTAAGGLLRFAQGSFSPVNELPPQMPQITSLYEDRAGHLWVNGHWRGESGRFGRAGGVPEELNIAWTMHEDRAGAFWTGTMYGVARYQGGVTTVYTTKNGLAGDDTKVIIEDMRDPTGGSLWLGSYGGLWHV